MQTGREALIFVATQRGAKETVFSRTVGSKILEGKELPFYFVSARSLDGVNRWRFHLINFIIVRWGTVPQYFRGYLRGIKDSQAFCGLKVSFAGRHSGSSLLIR